MKKTKGKYKKSGKYSKDKIQKVIELGLQIVVVRAVAKKIELELLKALKRQKI